MAKESLQKKLSRVRPPRVHITYDVETGGAIEKREIPFVVGSDGGSFWTAREAAAGPQGAKVCRD